MIFGSKFPKRGTYSYHYAWFPVRLSDGRMIWLESYKRRSLGNLFIYELCEGSYE